MIKVIVHGDVPQDVIDEARKMGESMGIDEVVIGTPDTLDKIDLSGDPKVKILTKDRQTGQIGRGVEGIPRDVLSALVEALGLDKEWAKIPYNGTEGDSCNCPACNARRQEDGPDTGRDARMGIPVQKAGPGVDVVGAPMMGLGDFFKNTDRPRKTKTDSLKGVEEVMILIRKKQSDHFEKCDTLYEGMGEVKKLLESNRLVEATAKMNEISSMLDRFNNEK